MKKRKRILDLSAGARAVWHNKNHPLALYLDRRAGVRPDIVCDTRNIPESVGKGFDLVVWDPPHANCGPNSKMSKRYGHHTTAEILDTIEKTALQAWNITSPGAFMAFKWSSRDIRLQRVFDLMPMWEPLFGHLTKNVPRSQTCWTLFLRRDEYEEKDDL